MSNKIMLGIGAVLATWGLIALALQPGAPQGQGSPERQKILSALETWQAEENTTRGEEVALWAELGNSWEQLGPDGRYGIGQRFSALVKRRLDNNGALVLELKK